MSDDATLKEKVRRLPDKPGVYLMKDRLGRIIYVGKAKSLKKRVSSYFQRGRARTISQPKIRALIELITDLDTIEVKSEPEALLLEGKLIKQWRPRYNTDFTDDKRFLLVRVDPNEELPRFRLTRIKKDDRSRYFGPFAHSGLLRKTLAQMRRQFGILLADGTPQQLPSGHWRLYDDVRQELYGAATIVSGDDYRRRVDEACAFLEGKSREWLASLRLEMVTVASRHEFEKAAELRDVVFALEKTLAKTRNFTRLDPTRPKGDVDALRELGEALNLSGPPRAMECFDISHISGTFVVASMVHFTDGRPDKDQYRRFSIKSFIGNDDFKAMEEVVGRRYRRLRDESKPFPDLVVIDGGRGQISAALKAFFALDIAPPPLIGLAKKSRDRDFPRQSRTAEPAAQPPRAQPAPAPARRGPPLCQHLQRRPALAQNPRERARRFPRPRPRPPRRAAGAFWLDRKDPLGHGGAAGRSPRLRETIRRPAAGIFQNPTCSARAGGR